MRCFYIFQKNFGKISSITETDSVNTNFRCKTGYLVQEGMFLLTKSEVHTGKYSERSFDVRSERNEVHAKN